MCAVQGVLEDALTDAHLLPSTQTLGGGKSFLANIIKKDLCSTNFHTRDFLLE